MSKKPPVYYKTDEEIELIRENCLLVSKTLAHVASRLKPGVTGKEIDKEAEELIRDHGARPVFLGFNGFPATLCVSKNEAVVHGIPTDEPFREGDIVSVDCGTNMNGFCGDAAYTFAIGDIGQDVMDLLVATKESLYKAIENAVVGKRLGDVSFAVQDYCERKRRYGVVRELVGHGLGREMHEAPEVPNFGKRGSGMKLKSGLVIAIEPMVTLGKRTIEMLDDEWTIVTKDRKAAAHYEHTVAVRKGQADILSSHEMLEAEIKKNEYLTEIA